MKIINNKLLIRFIALFEFLIGLSAIAGGYGLITTNGLGMPVTLLKNSPFSSYFWPGVILLCIIGGSYTLASLTLLKHTRYMQEMQAVAGFGMLIWIFTELYTIRQPHMLQAIYFGFAILTLIFTLFKVKYKDV